MKVYVNEENDSFKFKENCSKEHFKLLPKARE